MKPTWLYILLFGVKLVHVAVPTVFTIVGIKSGFSADSGTQCLRIYLPSFYYGRSGPVMFFFIDC